MRAHPHDENCKVPPSTTNTEGSTIPPKIHRSRPQWHVGGSTAATTEHQVWEGAQNWALAAEQAEDDQKLRAGRVGAGG